MNSFLVLLCGIVFFLYAFGISAFIQNFINCHSRTIGVRKGSFPFNGILVYVVVNLNFNFIVNIFYHGNDLIFFSSNFLFNTVILLFLIVDLIFGRKRQGPKRITLDFVLQNWHKWCSTAFWIVTLYCIYLLIYLKAKNNIWLIWEVKSIGHLYLTAFFHILAKNQLALYLKLLTTYVNPFFMIAFVFYVTKHLYYIFTIRESFNIAIFVTLLAGISIMCLLLPKVSFINLFLIISALALIIYTQYNNFFSYHKILQAGGLLLISYFIGSQLNLYVWIIIAFVYLVLQIATSTTEISAKVVLFCFLGIIPFSFEVATRLINHDNGFSFTAKILWTGALVAMCLFTYCIFARSGTIRLIDYILNINKVFSVASVVFLATLFAFSTSQQFALHTVVPIWKQNLFFLNHYLHFLTKGTKWGVQLFCNMLFFAAAPTCTVIAMAIYWARTRKKALWTPIVILHLVFAVVCFNPLAMTIWSVLLSQFTTSLEVDNAFSYLWLALVLACLALLVIMVINKIMTKWLSEKNQATQQLVYWRSTKILTNSPLGLKHDEYKRI